MQGIHSLVEYKLFETFVTLSWLGIIYLLCVHLFNYFITSTFIRYINMQIIINGKVHPETNHEDPEGE